MGSQVAIDRNRHKPSRYLFVYGTLMSWADGAMGRGERNRLSRETRSLGPGSFRGRLYDLGEYPGAITSEVSADAVHGEVFELLHPAVTLRWLDHYEGVRRGGTKYDDYRRIILEATLANSLVIEASVYIYQRTLRKAHFIRSGIWRAR